MKTFLQRLQSDIERTLERRYFQANIIILVFIMIGSLICTSLFGGKAGILFACLCCAILVYKRPSPAAIWCLAIYMGFYVGMTVYELLVL